METRIPVSLKFETEDELYYSLVEPLRVNKRLSSFIVSLFDVYFHNDQVKELVDDFISLSNSVDKINSHIQRIAELQGNNMRLIEDYEQSISSVSAESSSNNASSNSNDELKAVLERLASLENTVYRLVETMGVSGGKEVVTNNQRSASSISSESSESGHNELLSQNNIKTENSGLNGSTAVENQNGVGYGGNNKNGSQGDYGGAVANSNSVVAVAENSGDGEDISEAESLLGGFMDSLF